MKENKTRRLLKDGWYLVLRNSTNENNTMSRNVLGGEGAVEDTEILVEEEITKGEALDLAEGAELGGADLRNVKYNERTAFFALICPEEGDFIAWKKVGKVIVKLRIPAEAKRSSATTRKCRCEYAEVLELQNLDGTPYDDDKVVNNRYVETIYKVGEIVSADSWDDDRWNECSHGIHFFLTRDEAVRYQL